MLYFTIHKAKKRCQICNKSKELTIRKIFQNGAFIRSNLQAVCNSCAKKIDKKNKLDPMVQIIIYHPQSFEEKMLQKKKVA